MKFPHDGIVASTTVLTASRNDQNRFSPQFNEAALFYGGMVMRFLLDRPWVDDCARGSDKVSATIQNMKVTCLVKISLVPGPEVSVGENDALVLRAVQVGLQPRRGLHLDVAGHSRRQFLAVRADYAQVHPTCDLSARLKDAARGKLAVHHVLFRAQQCDGGQHLSLTVSLLEDRPETVDRLFELCRRHWRRAIDNVVHRRKIPIDLCWHVQQVDQVAWGEEEPGHSELCDGGDE